MKCLDKKRIKLKQGETLALNERIMLSMVRTKKCSIINVHLPQVYNVLEIYTMIWRTAMVTLHSFA